MQMIKQTKYHSYCTNSMAKGCKLCVQGRKLVLFITGLCPQRCFYCPVSDHKFGMDVIYANETKVQDIKGIFKEVRLTNAHGAGITGGDPLVKVDRCAQYIKALKQEFGEEFHCHLYTPLKIVNEEKLKKLFDAGLDEIRFHPDLDDKTLWPKLKLAKKFSWDCGIEIPCVPGYEKKMFDLIDYAKDKVDFINLNELELSDTKASHYKLDKMGFKQKDPISYGVARSYETGMKVLEYSKKNNLPAYFCTAKLKDSIQVGNRIKFRAKNVKLPFDTITSEGMLIRGCIYQKTLQPGVGYRNMLKTINRDKSTKELESLRDKIAKDFKTQDVAIDENKPRLIVPAKFVKRYSEKIKKMNLVPAIVEEYPTSDAFEIQIDFL